MPACALCENVQPAGEACDVCGHPFPVEQRTPVPVEPLEGLEATVLPPEAVVAEPLPDLEATSVEPIQVEVPVMEGLEPTEAEGIPEDPLAGPVATPTCRYCQTPAPAGEAFCIRCGMRLPTSPGSGDPGPIEVMLCSECSIPVRGSSCPGCGARVSR